MVRLIITPEITDRNSWKKISKLLNSTLPFERAKILYTPTLDAKITAGELQEKIAQLAEKKGLTKTIMTYTRQEEFLSKGLDEIIKYLESEAYDEAKSYRTLNVKKPNIILILDLEISKTLPNYIWKKMLKAEHFGINPLKQGQGIFFNFKRNCAQGSTNIYLPYSCTPLF